MMNEIRIVKLGGSLLDWSESPERLASWLQDQSPARTVIIVGGGELVEALRRLDRVLQLDQDDVHFAAIDLMTITAKLFHSKFPSWNLCTEESLSRSSFRSEASILDVAKWARSKTGLQKSWSVSSDSIAAAVADMGVVQASSYQAAEAVRDGRLLPVLRSFEAAPTPVSLVYPSKRLVPLKLRAFLDFAAPRLSARLEEVAQIL